MSRTLKNGVNSTNSKEGGGRKVEDYRGVTVMTVVYKIYAEVLRKRLEEEVEKGRMIPHN